MGERRGAAEDRPEPLLDVGRKAVEKVEVEHGAVERADAAAHGDGLVQRGNIAEADDGSRVARQRVEVDAVEDARDAVAAARAEDGVDVVRPQVMVELRETL